MKSDRQVLTAVVIGVALAGAGGALAQDWPQWRGSNREGKAAAFSEPKTWPKELTRKWKVTVGQGDATPALSGDKLFVFTRQEGNEVVRCLDASSGKELWQDKYEAQGSTGPSSSHSGPRSSPAVADGKVVTLGVRGTLTAYDTAGKKLWRKDDFPGAWPKFFVSSSPLVVDGLCIAQLGGAENGGIVAYSLESGEQKWKWTGDGPAYASPAPLKVDGTKLILAETDKKIVALGAADGKLAWETPFAVQGMSYNASSPIVEGSTAVFTGSNRGARAVKFEKNGDGVAAKELWTNNDNSVQFSTPVLKNGFLFGINQRNQLFSVNAQDGKTAWTAPPPQSGEGEKSEGKEKGEKGGKGRKGGRGGMGGGGRGFGSMVDAGPVLLALSPSSELLVVKPSEKEYIELAKYKVADSPTYAHPVVSGNRIIVKDEDSLTLWTIE
jgi:outer membrane protein assembly factor BamB